MNRQKLKGEELLMIKNIDTLVRKIGADRDKAPRDHEYRMAIDKYSEALERIEIPLNTKEERVRLKLDVDSAAGDYSAMASTLAYTQGFRDCLRGIFALLTAVE